MLQQQLTDFTLQAFYPYTPFLGASMETGETLQGIFDPIPAQVPGSVYTALRNAGLIEDPYYEMNSLLCEWVPARWWLYRTTFSMEKQEALHYVLRLSNLDFKAHIYLNHQKLGTSENLFCPFTTDITALLQENNELEILLEHAPDECGQIGYTSRTTTQKPRFNYKWDWCMRMIGVGIGGPVEIHAYDECRLESIFEKQTFLEDGSCRLDVQTAVFGYRRESCTASVTLWDQEVPVARETLELDLAEGTQAFHGSLLVKDPQLWWPNGHGQQHLYRLEVVVYGPDKQEAARKSVQVGLRHMQHLPCPGASSDALPYRLNINGKDIYIKGVNLTPLEMNCGDVTVERIQSVLKNIASANCNLIRIWGGGYIGSDALYDTCDRLGILVWQEFPQSSAGIDNIPSKKPEFLQQLGRTVAAVAVQLQTHPSLAFYSGGNELADADNRPVDFQDENIRLIRDTLRSTLGEYDCCMMLPSSASGPNYFLNLDTPGKNHDVHGPWKYEGVTGHYTLYNRSDSLFHSEFGVDGMANLDTLRQVLSPAHLHVTDMAHDAVWRHLGELWDTYDRTVSIFGSLDREDLETFVQLSQYIQGEGLRYALEANRRRAFQNSGSIIWQYNEPCANVSGTYLEDYFGRFKLAYWFVRDAFRTLTPSLRYEKLLWHVGDSFSLQATILNDGHAFSGALHTLICTDDGAVLQDTSEMVVVEENQNLALTPWQMIFPNSPAITVQLTLTGSGIHVRSEYLLLRADEQDQADRMPVLHWIASREWA